jgi:HK97 family phage portal protein
VSLFRRRTEERSVSYQDVFGRGDSIEAFGGGESRALQLVPVFASTRLLADSIASLPLQQFRRASDGSRQQMELSSLFASPSQHGTSYEWVQRAVTSLTLRGNAFGYVTQYGSSGYPSQVEWLHPDCVSVGEDSTMAPARWFVLGRPVDGLVHIPGHVLPGRVLGLSPIRAYALTTDTGLLSQAFGRDWFANGKTPSAVLSTDQALTSDQAETMKARFMASSKDREPIVLGAGLAYKPLMVPPEESQFLATMKATTNQIASIYGIPPEMIGGESGSSLTYANVEQQAINFVTYTLRPYITKLEATLSALLPRPQFVRFNVDSIIRADLKARYEAHQIGLSAGFLNRDEVRAIENRTPLPDGKGQAFAPIQTPSPSPTGGK